MSPRCSVPPSEKRPAWKVKLTSPFDDALNGCTSAPNEPEHEPLPPLTEQVPVAPAKPVEADPVTEHELPPVPASQPADAERPTGPTRACMAPASTETVVVVSPPPIVRVYSVVTPAPPTRASV